MSKVYLWFNLSTTVLVLLHCSVGAFHCFAQDLKYLSLFYKVLNYYSFATLGKWGMDNGWIASWIVVIAISPTIRVDKIKYLTEEKEKELHVWSPCHTWLPKKDATEFPRTTLSASTLVIGNTKAICWELRVRGLTDQVQVAALAVYSTCSLVHPARTGKVYMPSLREQTHITCV